MSSHVRICSYCIDVRFLEKCFKAPLSIVEFNPSLFFAALYARSSSPCYFFLNVVCFVYSAVLLIHPRQREGQESWKNMMHRAYCVNSITLGETQRDVSTTQGTRRIKEDPKRSKKTG